jgi:hypothetical protein
MAKKVTVATEGEGEALLLIRPRMDHILIDPHQSRIDFEEEAISELSNSIAKIGQEQAIVVNPAKGRPGYYYIFFGESRYRACKRNGNKTILCVVRKEEYDGELDVHRILRQGIENECRRGHKHHEKVRMMRLLLEYEKKIKEWGHVDRAKKTFAGDFGRTIQWAENYKALTNLHPDLLKLIDRKGSGLTFMMGVDLARNDQGQQKAILEEAKRMNEGSAPAMLQRAISIISRKYKIASGRKVYVKTAVRRAEYFSFFQRLTAAVYHLTGSLSGEEFVRFEKACLEYGLGDKAPATLLQAKQILEFLQARASVLEEFIASKK